MLFTLHWQMFTVSKEPWHKCPTTFKWRAQILPLPSHGYEPCEPLLLHSRKFYSEYQEGFEPTIAVLQTAALATWRQVHVLIYTTLTRKSQVPLAGVEPALPG